jgi:hypothetical protein
LKQGDKELIGNKGYRKYVQAASEEHFTIDEAKVKEEAQQFRNVGLTPGVFAERPVFSLWPSAIALKGGWPPP